MEKINAPLIVTSNHLLVSANELTRDNAMDAMVKLIFTHFEESHPDLEFSVLYWIFLEVSIPLSNVSISNDKLMMLFWRVRTLSAGF